MHQPVLRWPYSWGMSSGYRPPITPFGGWVCDLGLNRLAPLETAPHILGLAPPGTGKTRNPSHTPAQSGPGCHRPGLGGEISARAPRWTAFLSRMRERGVTTDVVASWHGHTERMTMQVYSRVSDDRLKAAAAAISG
jgi:hypothetical protein